MTVLLVGVAMAVGQQVTIPPYPDLSSAEVFRGDWLVDRVGTLAKAYRGPGANEVTIDNGLVRRTFRVSPDGATVDLQNVQTRERFLRAVKPEAVLRINGKDYPVGGLKGQPNLAFLKPEWLDKMVPNEVGFHLVGVTMGPVSKPFDWKRSRPGSDAIWPPRGVAFKMRYTSKDFPEVIVEVQHELYDSLPVLMKRVAVRNFGAPMEIEAYQSEILGVVEPESNVESSRHWESGNLEPLTDYSFHSMTYKDGDHTSRWLEDPEYKTQVNYLLKTPCLFSSGPELGPKVFLRPNSVFESHRSFVMLHDSTDRERRGLAIRRFFRLLSPWTTENPLMLHLTSTNEGVVKEAMDKASEVGFETVIFSFGSGLTMEDASPANIAKFREFSRYGHSKGLEVGGYSLLASRSIDAENDVINPTTGKPGGAVFGNSPCLGSVWGKRYFESLRTFLSQTGFDLLEHDGSYPGDVCASKSHPGHQGLEDSQWSQWQTISGFYGWCRSQGIYLNVPDFYFLSGSSKNGMGYRETNWSLPRDQQHIHARQNMYDGTWLKSPSQGWMFVPLVEYHGGGPEATIEPLRDNLKDYEMHLVNCLAFGVQACYRGPRLFDSPETKAVVTRWVGWFKEHREVLESDVIHLRRADGRDYDAILHVNPAGKERAMLCVWNPLKTAIQREIEVPLRYAGLSGTAKASVSGAAGKSVTLDARQRAVVKVSVPAEGFVWVLFEG